MVTKPDSTKPTASSLNVELSLKSTVTIQDASINGRNYYVGKAYLPT